jgi:hypothetical protein
MPQRSRYKNLGGDQAMGSRTHQRTGSEQSPNVFARAQHEIGEAQKLIYKVAVDQIQTVKDDTNRKRNLADQVESQKYQKCD